MKNVKKLILTGLVATLMAAPSAYAATADGDEGVTSQGTSDVTITIPKLVKITDIDGIPAAAFDGNTDMDEVDDVCIFSNMSTAGGTEKYRVTITNANSADNTSGFYLGNAANDQEVLFTVKWNDVTASNVGEAAVTEGTPLLHQVGFDNDPTCGGGDDARYHVQATAANLLAVKPGVYSSVLTILIEPE
jgi:hypothetical protein